MPRAAPVQHAARQKTPQFVPKYAVSLLDLLSKPPRTLDPLIEANNIFHDSLMTALRGIGKVSFNMSGMVTRFLIFRSEMRSTSETAPSSTCCSQIPSDICSRGSKFDHFDRDKNMENKVNGLELYSWELEKTHIAKRRPRKTNCCRHGASVRDTMDG